MRLHLFFFFKGPARLPVQNTEHVSSVSSFLSTSLSRAQLLNRKCLFDAKVLAR